VLEHGHRSPSRHLQCSLRFDLFKPRVLGSTFESMLFARGDVFAPIRLLLALPIILFPLIFLGMFLAVLRVLRHFGVTTWKYEPGNWVIAWWIGGLLLLVEIRDQLEAAGRW
jgi:hypothetical protein